MANSSMEYSLERAADAVNAAMGKVDRTISVLERIANALELQAICQVATRCTNAECNIRYAVLLDRAQDILHPVKCKDVAGNTPYRGDQ